MAYHAREVLGDSRAYGDIARVFKIRCGAGLDR